MREFQTEIYRGTPPFGTNLFHKDIEPKDESFLEMARFTFFPYFYSYTFCFFWLVLISFVFFYSQSYRIPQNFVEQERNDEFLKVSQAALFELGENYPYHIVRNYHYYRVLTSMVLFRNFYHYILTFLSVLTLGSYTEKIIGFKRCFVLAIVTGVSGILCNNVFNYNATLESTTPVAGIVGYCFGYFLSHWGRDWKYYLNERVNMALLLLFLCLLYADIINRYSNINLMSNLVALGCGFMFCFADPGQNKPFTLGSIVMILILAGILSIIVLWFFFHTSPDIIQ